MLNLQEDKKPILLEDLGMQYYTEKSKKKSKFGLYKCGYCGKEFKGNTYAINGGRINSCGCRVGGITHNLHKHKLYGTWRQMCQRCDNKNHWAYDYYGGRGIKVCEEWLDIKNFIEWADSTHIEGYTLDRVDNDGNYEPSNCKWSSKTEQNTNQKIRKDNSTGFVGVYNFTKNRFKSGIGTGGKFIQIGIHNTLEEAVEARDNYIISNNLPHKLSKDYVKKEEE